MPPLREIDCGRCQELVEQVAVQLPLSADTVVAELNDDYCNVQFDGAVAETCVSYVRSFMPTATEFLADYLRGDAVNACATLFDVCV